MRASVRKWLAGGKELRTTMMKTGKIRRCQGLHKLGNYFVGMRNPPKIVFFINCVSKTMVLLLNEILLCEKT